MIGQLTSNTDAEAYVSGLRGWQRACVENLRKQVRAAAKMEEAIKWGHLVYASNGPVLLIRAEEQRVLFGFWRGQRLCEIEPALRAGGKYEMATLELHEGARIGAATVRRLTQEAVALNALLGNPTKDVKRKPLAKKGAKDLRK
jgi:hypothetical protein